jgi:hypothetical protein
MHQPQRAPLELQVLEDRCDICGVMPTALDDEYWATAGELLTILPGGVLENDGLGAQGGPEDTDPCGTTLSAVLVQGPDDGSLSLNSDGSFTFTKETAGTVTFTYMACDELNYCSTVATVTIMVQKAAGQVKFTQEKNPPNGPFGTYIGYGPYGQPGGRSTGAYYGSAAEGVWQAAPAWATSYVSVWTTAAGQDVCNSGPGGSGTTGTGRLTAWLKGTPGSPYTVTLDVDVSVNASSPSNNPYSRATVIDKTTTPQTEIGAPATTVSNGGHDSFYAPLTLTVTIPAGGVTQLIVIQPTLCGTNAPGAGTADFTGTIYVYSIV